MQEQLQEAAGELYVKILSEMRAHLQQVREDSRLASGGDARALSRPAC